MTVEFRKLEQRIKKGESFATAGFITENNIFMALAMKTGLMKDTNTYSDEAVFDLINQLDRKTSKVSIATRVLAISKVIAPQAIDAYCFVNGEYGSKVVRSNSMIVDFIFNRFITRNGFEQFVEMLNNQTNHNQQYVAEYLMEQHTEHLVWYYENVDFTDSDRSACICGGSVRQTLQHMLERYSDSLDN